MTLRNLFDMQCELVNRKRNGVGKRLAEDGGCFLCFAAMAQILPFSGGILLSLAVPVLNVASFTRTAQANDRYFNLCRIPMVNR